MGYRAIKYFNRILFSVRVKWCKVLVFDDIPSILKNEFFCELTGWYIGS